ncbi:hypothetical protein DB32_004763 [Sandaracinus amylolyticus]|uniref:Uncharacterized protein n=2 Tax=Sandaracinus amylolyticus TaxID=927083 RepID=A0A0F6SFV7_9BACT|nr:hypothetical protein DB32_004763 [Sandaracinus amylolyticus]
MVMGCGGAPPPPPAPAPEPVVERAPPPPRVHTIVLSAALPRATRTNSGLAPDGTLYCRQTYFATPPSDERACVADGYGITAPVMHAIDPTGAALRYVDGPLSIVRIDDCGNGERPVRRPPASLVRRLAPELAAAPRSETIDLRAVQFASCPLADLALRVPDGVELTARGAVLRMHASEPADIELAVAGETRHAWSLDAAGDLELEVLCNERFVVVAAGIVADDEASRATTREQTLACTPTVRAWRSFERIRIDRERGVVTPVEIVAPTFSTALR